MTDSVQKLAPDVYDLPEDEAYKGIGAALGDRRDGRVYVHTDRIRRAVEVAQATNRPLLLRGRPGSGKSSLAPFISRSLGRRFYSVTVNSRTQARDLLYEFDSLRRLSDAQAHDERARVMHRYVEPRALWWAFDPNSAARRGAAAGDPGHLTSEDPVDPGEGPIGADPVVLIDEIDKADPDLPNGLLEPLGSHQFTVTELGVRIPPKRKPLIVVTTNEERDLPAAFLRRCVVLFLPDHDKTDLQEIARRHFGPDPSDLYSLLADELLRLRTEAESGRRRAPSTAEYLDAVKACRELGIYPRTNAAEWEQIRELTLSKSVPATVTGRSDA